MTFVRATCSLCDTSNELPAPAFHVTVFDHGQGNYFRFLCPTCGQVCQRFCDQHAMHLLVSNGVPSTLVHVPLEFLENMDRDDAPLNLDDLLDLMLALKRNDGCFI